jgi:PhzF family phenazine biosynthesis protein
MKLQQFQVDAFARRVFEGNPAAVCPLDAWLPEALMQAIAAENNLSETAFFVPAGEGFDLRWFTPRSEVDLCGHATLATAHVLFAELAYAQPEIRFATRSGELRVTRTGDLLSMDFPRIAPLPCPVPEALLAGLGATPQAVLAADDYLVVLADATQVRALTPDLRPWATLDRRGVCVTAPGAAGVDFVSRFFAPKYGIDEDPVTGSAHCMLAPYWAGRLGKDALVARQVSRRGGEVHCRLAGERVLLSGHAVTFMVAQIDCG